MIAKKKISCNKYDIYNHIKLIFTIKYDESMRKGGKNMHNYGSSSAIILVLFILLVIILGAYI